jgi:hypothetical protein
MQPMTIGPNSEIALQRVTKALKSKPIAVKGIPFEIQFAGVSTPFDLETMPTLKALVKAVQNDLKLIASRLSNLQRMM